MNYENLIQNTHHVRDNRIFDVISTNI